MRKRSILAVATAATVGAALAAPLAQAGPPPPAGASIIYDAVQQPLPGNQVSQPFQAQQTSEFGDSVNFAGTQRLLRTVTVTMSSWACQNGGGTTCSTTPGSTFAEPITFNVYAPGSGAIPGARLATLTQTFNIPYRPSADTAHCPDGGWYNGSQCFHGLATNVTFDFSAQKIVLPNSVVYGIAYNTSGFGYSPYGYSTPCSTSSTGCPYDSLNVALSPNVITGSQANPGTVYWNTATAGYYCDGGTAGVGIFRLDSPAPNNTCWTGYVPAVQFTAAPVPGPNATCTGILPAGFYNDVTIPAGASCEIDNGVIINHDLTVQKGAFLVDQGAGVGHDIKAGNPGGIGIYAHPTIGNNITVNGVTGGSKLDGQNFICSATVGGNVSVTGSVSGAAPWSIGGSDCGLGNLSIGNDLVVNNNKTFVDVSRNTVNHDMHVDGNTAGALVSNNMVGNNATCNKDNPPATGSDNTAGGTSTCPV